MDLAETQQLSEQRPLRAELSSDEEEATVDGAWDGSVAVAPDTTVAQLVRLVIRALLTRPALSDHLDPSARYELYLCDGDSVDWDMPPLTAGAPVLALGEERMALCPADQ